MKITYVRRTWTEAPPRSPSPSNRMGIMNPLVEAVAAIACAFLSGCILTLAVLWTLCGH